MAKKPTVPKRKIRMMRAADASEYATEFRGGWYSVDEITDPMRKIAAARKRTLVDLERQAFLEFVDRNKENGT